MRSRRYPIPVRVIPPTVAPVRAVHLDFHGGGWCIGRAASGDAAAAALADYFDVHLDHAPKEGATLELDSIVLVARSISGGRVNLVGLRLPEEEEEAVPLTRLASFKRKLAELWSSVAGV